MSTGRTTDDRDLDSRRHRELKAVLDDVHRRVIRIERMLGPRPVTLPPPVDEDDGGPVGEEVVRWVS